jgi:hypothetical protein
MVVLTILHGCERREAQPRPFFQLQEGDKVILHYSTSDEHIMVIQPFGSVYMKVLEVDKDKVLKEADQAKYHDLLTRLKAAVADGALVPEDVASHTFVSRLDVIDGSTRFTIAGPGRMKPGEEFDDITMFNDQYLRTLYRILDDRGEYVLFHFIAKDGTQWIVSLAGSEVRIKRDGQPFKEERIIRDFSRLVSLNLMHGQPVNSHSVLRHVENGYRLITPSGVAKDVSIEDILNDSNVGVAFLTFIRTGMQDNPVVLEARAALNVKIRIAEGAGKPVEEIVLHYVHKNGNEYIVKKKKNVLEMTCDGKAVKDEELLNSLRKLLSLGIIKGEPPNAHTTIRREKSGFSVQSSDGRERKVNTKDILFDKVLGPGMIVFLGPVLKSSPIFQKAQAELTARAKLIEAQKRN